VVRGGAWDRSDAYCASSSRVGARASSRLDETGFRPVLAVVLRGVGKSIVGPA
jgi:formylglycine-generating enzyme required for sulfatase activity